MPAAPPSAAMKSATEAGATARGKAPGLPAMAIVAKRAGADTPLAA